MFTIVRKLPCRRNVNNMQADEKAAFVNAVKNLKAAGGYDPYVLSHQDAMDQGTPPGTNPLIRNAAHRGPAFLPWHREFLRLLELDLRNIDSSVAIPYWDWAADEALPDPTTATVWENDLMGGDGDGPGNVVTTGPFRQGEWETVDSSGSPAGALRREFGVNVPTLPTQAEVNNVLGRTPYDTSPWDTSSNPSFRNEVEGWINGPALHNRVHVWVGGDMLPGTSPNDPVFFLNHCFEDKIWADWQAQHPTEQYLPQIGGPAGHNVGDAMYPWATTPADVLNHQEYYLYDTDPPIIENKTTAITFEDIPEGETTYRAVLFEVTTCSLLNLQVIAGPGAGFGVLSSNVTIDPGREGVFGEARLWISYTGTSDGDSASGSVTIRAVETGEEWTINITANTVSRPTAAVVLALDKSGSMNSPSGIPGQKRIDVLRYSAAPFVDLIQEGNALGIVSFDQDAYDVMPVTGPLGPPGPFDTDRATAAGHIATHNTNPSGLTAIGDALEQAHNLLLPETSYDVRAIVVLTDGHETAPKYISEVSEFIDERVYAIGLGTADQIQPAALTALTNGSGGYMYVTGALNNDLYFRLAKYYLQVLAGVTNEDIVVDPQGWVAPGQVQRIPFTLSETDISSDVILLSPVPWVFKFWLETPQGDVIDPGVAAGLPAVNFVSGNGSAYYRMTLPVPTASGGAQEGTWYAALAINEDNFDKYLGSLDNQPEELRKAKTHGVRYSLNVHSYSNLRMRPQLSQNSYEPGATIHLNVVMSEYGLPMTARVQVSAEVTFPNETTSTIILSEVGQGVFEADVSAMLSGVYTFRVIASGRTLRGRDFSREHTLTGAVWRGGNDPAPKPIPENEERDERLCRLFKCLLRDEALGKFLIKQDIDVEIIRKCFDKFCVKQTSGRSQILSADITTIDVINNPRFREAVTMLMESIRE